MSSDWRLHVIYAHVLPMSNQLSSSSRTADAACHYPGDWQFGWPSLVFFELIGLVVHFRVGLESLSFTVAAVFLSEQWLYIIRVVNKQKVEASLFTDYFYETVTAEIETWCVVVTINLGSLAFCSIEPKKFSITSVLLQFLHIYVFHAYHIFLFCWWHWAVKTVGHMASDIRD